MIEGNAFFYRKAGKKRSSPDATTSVKKLSLNCNKNLSYSHAGVTVLSSAMFLELLFQMRGALLFIHLFDRDGDTCGGKGKFGMFHLDFSS